MGELRIKFCVTGKSHRLSVDHVVFRVAAICTTQGSSMAFTFPSFLVYRIQREVAVWKILSNYPNIFRIGSYLVLGLCIVSVRVVHGVKFDLQK